MGSIRRHNALTDNWYFLIFPDDWIAVNNGPVKDSDNMYNIVKRKKLTV